MSKQTQGERLAALEAKQAGHERECQVRYTGITRRLDDGKARMDRLDKKLDRVFWLLAVLIAASGLGGEQVLKLLGL